MSLDIVSPRDCELLVGIPLSAEDFTADLARPGLEYGAIFRDKFPGARLSLVAGEYERLVAKPVRAMAEKVARLGVRVERCATHESLAPAFARSRVVALMAHSPEPESEFPGGDADMAERSAWRCIELRDGPATVGELAGAIPADWNGIVDFVACESSIHAHALKRRHPGSTFIVNRGSATPVFRMRRFHASIALLRQQPKPYGDAVVAVLNLAAGKTP